MRHAWRRDSIEDGIEDLLRANGFQTLAVNGVPFDLIVWSTGSVGFLLMEVKSRGGRLKPSQARFFAATDGQPRVRVESPETAVHVANFMLRQRRDHAVCTCRTTRGRTDVADCPIHAGDCPHGVPWGSHCRVKA